MKAIDLKNWQEKVRKADSCKNWVCTITDVFLCELIDTAIEEYIDNNK
jgi:diacylglycerol kinase